MTLSGNNLGIKLSDTITAIATASGQASIAVIRVSGRQALTIADKIFCGKIKPSRALTHTVHYGNICDPKTKEPIDEVLLTVFFAPNSYTGEDMVEISCHGGNYIASTILDNIIKLGARLAEPGEFTKRRVLAGKIDITQAEAILELVNAQNISQHRSAIAHLQGKLSSFVNTLRSQLLTILAHLEYLLEFEEDSNSAITDPIMPKYKKILQKLKTLRTKIEDILLTNQQLKFLRQGVICPIIGRPNVGKSSLFNRLCEAERAIVTEIPGTTRDSLEATISIQGITFHLIDTAGLKTLTCANGIKKIEALGIAKSKNWLESADMVLGVFDNSSFINHQDRLVFDAVKSKPHLWVLNKIDLKSRFNHNLFNGDKIYSVSAKYNQGIDRLKQAMVSYYRKKLAMKITDHFLALNTRHLDILSRVVSLIKGAETEKYLDATIANLRIALDTISTITNGVNNEQILDTIFSKFCIGK